MALNVGLSARILLTKRVGNYCNNSLHLFAYSKFLDISNGDEYICVIVIVFT